MSNGNKSLKNFFNSNKFIGSFQSYKDIKKIKTINDCCFVGRSNVGKSSMINAVTKTKNLAKTSKTPGRTQSINIFMINENINLVDLPGYGYAKASKSEKKNFQKLITDYFINRNQLISAFILVDVRHEAQKIDIEFMRWLTINKIAFSIVFTKIDKLKQDGNPNSGIEEKLKKYKSVILENWEYLPEIFLTSSTKHIGKENILYYIDKLNSDINQK